MPDRPFEIHRPPPDSERETVIPGVPLDQVVGAGKIDAEGVRLYWAAFLVDDLDLSDPEAFEQQLNAANLSLVWMT